ncbi:MAG: carboxy terminal-processing peptidase [Desulfuromonadaceae bacterium]|nr:carboxy terminal-processing peptidase [Desulfuromonadaceae bacterium]
MRFKQLSRIIALLLTVVLGLLLVTGGSFGKIGQDDDELANRTKLLGYLLREKLRQEHYSRKPFDDTFSTAAFSLFLKQLDSQKRFLLQGDVAELRRFATKIDDEMQSGQIELPFVAGTIMQRRIGEAQKTVEQLFAGKFDFDRDETLETDIDKLDYCNNAAALRDRWRKIVKYQTITRYLNLLEDESEALAKKTVTQAALREQAREKTRKKFADYFSRLLEEQPQERVDRYFNAVTRAFDPHTNYLPPKIKEDFDISMRGSLEGIGATLREEDGYIKVIQIIPGSAADRQGQLAADDIILTVAQGRAEPVEITDMRLRDAVSLIRGKKGTEVRLTVKKSDGRKLIIPIIRDVVQIEETFVKSTTLKDSSGNLFGYIRIPSFYRDFKETRNGGDGRNATDDVRAALETLSREKIAGLILDLRNNGGGALTDAVAIAGLFIESGPVVQVKDSRDRIQVLRDRDQDIDYRGPMVVLVNKFSASASEILAGALQDYRRALIVGSDHTHGKGTVQTMVDLDQSLSFKGMEKYRPLGALKVTTQKFYRINGESTQERGVIPDIILPDRMKYLKSGEKYSEYALPWDEVAPSPFRLWDKDAKSIDLLKQKSLQRVTANTDFAEIDRDAERARKRSEDTRQSLRIDAIKAERAEENALHPEQAEAAANNKRKAGKSETAEERRQKWLDELNEDPYLLETINILDDIVAG